MSNQIAQIENVCSPIQTKVFSRWVTQFLRKRGIIVKDVTTQLTTGVNLVNLAEILTSGSLKIHQWIRNPTKPFQKEQNCELALQMFKDDGTNVSNVTPKEITDGNVKKIMSLLWTLIVKYTIEKASGVSIPNTKSKRSLVHSISRWFNMQTSQVENGRSEPRQYHLLFAFLISKFKPELINYKADIKNNSNFSKEQISQLVIDTLNKLEIPVYLDPEDLLEDIDEKSLITQIATLKQVFQPNEYIEEDQYSIDNFLEECESEEVNDQDHLDIDLDEDSQPMPEETVVYEEPQPNRPFMLYMTINDINNSRKEMAVTVVKSPPYLNPAGMKLDLAEPDITDAAQKFTFGVGEWITVIDSVMQPGMVWDVADKDNLNPPEGTPFYMFMFHGRHNQRFTYKNGHIIAKQNGQFVTYVGGETPMVMRLDNSNLLQTFRLEYV